MDREDRSNVTPDAASMCVKCGTCRPVCPVFGVRALESSGARGKMALIEAVSRDRIEQTGRYREYLETCLLCGACEEACPSNVPTLDIMLRAREKMASGVGMKTGKGLILNHLLGAAKRFRFAVKTGRALQGFMFRRVPAASGLRRRFPLPLIAGDRTVPKLARRFFTDRFHGTVMKGEGPRVGIFAGCMTNYFYPEMGEGMMDLIADTGATVIVPGEQVCCGMPALTGGARGTVRDLAVQNLEAFEKYDLDFIVTGCATCGGNLKGNFGALLDEAGIRKDRIAGFVPKLQDINEFLFRRGLPGQTPAETPQDAIPELKVTYHHPCHLGRLQGIRDEPIVLMESLPGVKYVPMDEADRCCGMGGSFSVEHYDISKDVNDRKVKNIIASGTRTVVTSCPACIMHIRDGLIRNGHGDVEVLHVTDLLVKLRGNKRPT